MRERLRSLSSLSRQVPGTFRLVWATDRAGAVALALLTVLAAVLPAPIAWVGKLIVDGVVTGARGASRPAHVLALVAVELSLMALSMAATRSSAFVRELMRAKLGNEVNERILAKALDLELRHFEDADVYDKMQNARREASSRPLSLVTQAFSVVQNAITLAALSALLLHLSPWSVVVIVGASIPAFVAEARMAAESFRLNSWRAPEGRRLNYLEWILTRDSHVKEVKLFGLGPLMIGRYRALFEKFYDEDRRVALRRTLLGLLFGVVSLAAFYGCYAMVAARATRSEITVGDMALFITVFRQGQSAIQSILKSVADTYEDALYMSNLFSFFEIPTQGERCRSTPPRRLPRGTPHLIELRGVSFRYPGQQDWALQDVSLTIAPGEKLGLVGENGAGKTTLVKLLLRLYDPSEGSLLYGGVDVRDLDVHDLRERMAAVFQDFVRYQFSAAENIGLGNPSEVANRKRIEEAARRGGALPLIDSLPQRFDTVLGGWFETGHELSAGQWQKLAVARAFMRDAEVLILDEPTASIDAEAEHDLFQRFRHLAAERSAIIISHRFSTMRIADRVAVLHSGRLEELGTHDELVAGGGRYAHLFRLQARAYVA
ncbi:MAG TPA: ABC transporter ATP-binding protein [Anaeromyxobacter sp.]|nr:ABC transporter ATP-binding protein [Anaeromyxobacter sp.]